MTMGLCVPDVPLGRLTIIDVKLLMIINVRRQSNQIAFQCCILWVLCMRSGCRHGQGLSFMKVQLAKTCMSLYITHFCESSWAAALLITGRTFCVRLVHDAAANSLASI